MHLVGNGAEETAKGTMHRSIMVSLLLLSAVALALVRPFEGDSQDTEWSIELLPKLCERWLAFGYCRLSVSEPTLLA